MTAKKFSVTLPEDVAEQLDGVDNVSAYVAEALRLRRSGDRLREVFDRHGVHVRPEGVAAMRDRIAAQQARRRERPAA